MDRSVNSFDPPGGVGEKFVDQGEALTVLVMFIPIPGTWGWGFEAQVFAEFPAAFWLCLGSLLVLHHLLGQNPVTQVGQGFQGLVAGFLVVGLVLFLCSLSSW